MKGALMAGTTGRQRASGLTLVEVLATVFIMGLGLIMVAAAFPVGIDQVRRSVEDTQSSMAARSAVELLHGENVFQNMTKEWWDGLVVGGKVVTRPHGENIASNHYRVHNPWRRLYIDDGTEAMWPPEPGDLLWRAFLTRLTDTDEMPLFRATIVVVKYSQQSPELYIPDYPALTSWKALKVNSNSGNRIYGLATSNPKIQGDKRMVGISNLTEGDYLMDPHTGFCYRVVKFDEESHEKNQWLELATYTDPGIASGTDCWAFSNVVGIYYTMISG